MLKHSVSVSDLEHIFEHTSTIWKTMYGARIFITGGTGFIGKWLLESLIYANEKMDLSVQAVVLTRKPEQFAQQFPELTKNDAIFLHTGDVRDFQFPDGYFSHVIHGAADVSTTQAWLNTYDIIISGTKRVLDFCRARGMSNILLLSSGAIYGKQPPELLRIDEQYSGAPTTTLPQSAYGQSKRIAEWLASTYNIQYGMQCRIARCFALAGPHLPLNGHFALGNFITDAIQGNTLEIKGDGTPVRSYLYASDMTIWLWTILAFGKPGMPYNVGSEIEINMEELASLILTLSGSTQGLKLLHHMHKTLQDERYVPSTQLARELLGLQTWVPLDKALLRTIEWARSNVM